METMSPGERTKKKLRRFNSKVFHRQKTEDFVYDAFTLADKKPRYQERRTRADILHKQTSMRALVNSAMTLLVIFFAFVDNELKFYEQKTKLLSISLRILIIASSSLQIFLTINGAQKQLDLLKVLGSKHPSSTPHPASLFSDSLTSILLFCEVAHLCIVLPPIDGQYEESEERWGRIQDLVTFGVVLRVYHVVRFVYSQSPLFLPKAQFYTYMLLSNLHGIYNNPSFVVISQMTTRPFLTLFVAGGSVLLLGGLLYHVVERGTDSDLTVYDGPWVIAITQLTVGYGEISPKTDLGRIVAIGPGVAGVCTLSLVVTYALRLLQMSRPQIGLSEKLYHGRYIQKHLLTVTVTFLQRWWRLRMSRRFVDPLRLKKMLLFKLIHEKFRQKFAVDLAGPTQEFEIHISKLQVSIHKSFTDVHKKLRELTDVNVKAGKFSTDKFNQVARVLVCRQAYIRMKKIQPEKPVRVKKALRGMGVIVKKPVRRSTIVDKRASDIALRRMRVRLSVLQLIPSVIVNEESISSSDSSPLAKKPILPL